MVLVLEHFGVEGSDNPSGADNQQETVGIEAPMGSSETARQAPVHVHAILVRSEGTVRSPWRHGE